jgi:hypothetical protein
VTAGIGAERNERRDHRASPARYAGVGAGWALGLERSGATTLFQANVGANDGTLTSGGSGGEGQLRRETMDVSFQLRFRPNLFAGLEVGVRAEELEHTYPAALTTETFDIVTASLSPVVTWIPSWRGGTFRVRGSIAAASLVDREYSRTKAGDGVDEVAGPMTWSSATLDVTRIFRESERVSWRIGARATAWAYRVEIGAANVEARAAVGARVRLGQIK